MLRTAARTLAHVRPLRTGFRQLATTSSVTEQNVFSGINLPSQPSGHHSGHLPNISESLEGVIDEVEVDSIDTLLNKVQQRTTAESEKLMAQSITKPVYLTLSRLTYPQEGDPAVGEQVVELDPTVFNHPIRRDIIHLCVVQYRDSLRQGSANTKTRSEVRGSGRKIRPQKGSGKARLGDGQSPMLRGGGIAFGPKPRDFSTKLPKKVIEMGMRVALSAKLKERRLGVVESLDWPGMKTQQLARRITSLGWNKTLFVTGHPEVPEGLLRSGSNIPNVDFMTLDELKVYDVVYWPRIVLDGVAVDLLGARLSKLTPGVPAKAAPL